MTKREITKFLLLRTTGNFLLLFSLYGVGATFGPALTYEVKFRIAQARGVEYRVQDEPISSLPVEKQEKERIEPGFNEVLAGAKTQVVRPVDTDFSIVIPRIGASAKVFPNVNSENEAEFTPILQQGIAHARGTVFPGMKGNTYLFAHSTDNFWNVGQYNALFYLLKDLAKGDDVVVFFENKRHNYEVTESVIVNPEEVGLLTNAQTGDEQLVMQTCWPPGTTWKRLMVKAKPKKL